MRMKKIVENRTLKSAAAEFIAFKRAQKIRERTLHDYQKYINPFVEQSSNSMDIDVLKREILEYFANIPVTSPARYNHPYQYLHALFAWCAKQDYLPYNPFDKLELKKLKDEGNIKPATIADIQSFLKCLDKHNYCELRDYNITMVMLDTGIRTSEILSLLNSDYDPDLQCITIRPEVAKTSKSRTIYLSPITNTALVLDCNIIEFEIPNPEDAYEKKELGALVKKAVNQLKEPDREILLRFFTAIKPWIQFLRKWALTCPL